MDLARVQSRRRLNEPLVVALVVVGASAVVALRDPHSPGSYGYCPSIVLFGVACPACGGLRATYDLMHLDFFGAWGVNPGWVVIAPLLVLAWGQWVRRRWTGTEARRAPRGLWWAGAGFLLVYGILRNIPALRDALGP